MSVGPATDLVLGALWGLPLLALIPLVRRRPDVAAQRPVANRSTRVIIPARNESVTITTVLRSLLASTHDRFEIIVVDDRSTDDTAAQVATLARTDARLRLVMGDDLPDGWFGKPWACHQGAKDSDHEFLLFTDADTTHAPDLLARAIGGLIDTDADMLTLTSHQQCRTFWERVVMPQIWFLLGVRYSPSRINRATRPTEIVANGQFILMRRERYEGIGGHAAVRGEVVEDLALAQHALREGLTVRMLFGERLLATRMYRSLAEMLEGWTKNLYVGSRQSMGHHRLLRSLAPIALMVAFSFWLLPPVFLAVGIFPGAMIGAICWSILFWGLVNHGMQIPVHFALAYPIGAAMALLIIVRSTARGRRRILWKGREYGTT